MIPSGYRRGRLVSEGPPLRHLNMSQPVTTERVLAFIAKFRRRQRTPVPRPRHGWDQCLHHEGGLIQVNLVAAPRRGDVHAVGTQKVETTCGAIAGLALGFPVTTALGERLSGDYNSDDHTKLESHLSHLP